MSDSPHRLILASAGTGKTWQLSTRFVELLLAGAAPETILATTFTRKAAGEILDRVLQRLLAVATDEVEREALAERLGRPLPREEALALLARLTRHLHRFRVRTLDSFFAHLVRLFALDLGLPPDWTIVDEADDTALRREAVAAALGETEKDEILTLLRGLHQADASRSVESVLLRKVALGRNAFLDSRPEAWRRVQPPPEPAPEVIEAAITRLEGAPVALTSKGEPSKRWLKARDALAACARAGDWRRFPGLSLAKQLLDGNGTFYGQDIEGELAEAIHVLLGRVAHEEIRALAAENAAAHEWLRRFEKAYEGRKEAEGAFRFEDLPKALHPQNGMRLEDRDQVWYRIDGRVDHLLLDEFQDTAPIQWRILENLAGEILADGTGRRSFFCVGDVKQSIYGFREAEPRLLAAMAGRYPQLDVQHLVKSFRSSPVVLDTVDRVFTGLGGAPLEEPVEQAAAAEFRAQYRPHEANDERLPGAAWLIVAPQADEHGTETEQRLDLTARRIRDLLDEAPAARVGVLLRRKKLIPPLIYALRQRDVHASGEGGNPLTDSSAVLHLVSLLLLADHPDHTAAAFHAAHSPLGQALGLSPAGWDEERGAVSLRLRADLAAEGYGVFCDRLLPVVEEHYGAWDRNRFGQLTDLAHAFEARATLRPSLFVRHVRETRIEDPAASRVKVMTVHASKGLEFDAVFLPELDQALTHSPELLTRRPKDDPAGLLEAVSHARSPSICELDPSPGGLKDLLFEQRRRELCESFSLLYVAMTRAKHRLDLIVAPPKKKLARSFAGLVRAALAPDGVPDDDGRLWSHPDNTDPWYPPALAKPPAPEPSDDSPSETPERFLSPPSGRLPLPRTPSAAEGGGKLRPENLLRSDRGGARLLGTLIHRWFAEIEWLDDFERDEEALLALGRELTADERLLRTALDEFTAALERDAVRAPLLRPSGPDRLEVWRERAFSLTLPGTNGEEHWTGAFDRVVVRYRDGRPTSAQLLDFKTDAVRGDALAERARHYAPQIESYRRVLAHMTGLPEEAIEADLLFVREGGASVRV